MTPGAITVDRPRLFRIMDHADRMQGRGAVVGMLTHYRFPLSLTDNDPDGCTILFAHGKLRVWADRNG